MHRNELLDFKSMDNIKSYSTEYGDFKVFEHRKTKELIFFGYHNGALVNYSRNQKRCEMKVKLFMQRCKK